MEGDRVGTLVVGYSSCSQIPIDGGINSTQSQWAPARRSLGEHINQGSPCLGQNIHRSCQLYFSDMLMCISQICSCVFLRCAHVNFSDMLMCISLVLYFSVSENCIYPQISPQGGPRKEHTNYYRAPCLGAKCGENLS